MVLNDEARRELGQQLRVDSVRMASQAGSGHPTSSMSAADLMAVLLDGHLRLDFSRPSAATNDHLVFSKGHASPLYYAMLRAAGAVSTEELSTYREFGSRLEGHPTPRIAPTDVATGSLGQGMPIAVGLALAGRELDRLPYRVWVLCGDSELAEGSIWEAAQYAGWAGLDNLVMIADVNRLGQRGETMLGHDTAGYRRRFEAFGWEAIEIDGHDVAAIEQAYQLAEKSSGRPTVIVARTIKGKGVAAVEDQPGHHGKPVDDADAAIAELGGDRDMILPTASNTDARPHQFTASSDHSPVAWPRYELGSREATRKAFGAAVAALGSHDPRVVVLDGEVDNSTGAASFAERHPDRYFEMFIAEQQMVAAAVGMQVRGWRPIATSFAAFFARAYDFVRMASISRATMALVGSHAGVSIGADGPSQMAVEDIASLRAIHGSTVLHPSDATQTAALTAGLADRDGITFLRTLRGETTVRTRPEETVRVGGSRVAAGDSSRDPDVVVIGCGATIDEAVAAAERLAEDGYRAEVLDCYSIKPIDREAISNAALRCRNFVTVEDHRPEGGLGDAVLEALADSDALTDIRVRKLAVRDLPTSGAPDELRRAAGIDTEAIVQTARQLLASTADAEGNAG
jgi:transketolase